MSVHYHVNVFKIGLVLVLLSATLFSAQWQPAKPHPKGFYDTFNGEVNQAWEYSVEGDQDILSCTLESNESRENFGKDFLKNLKKKALDEFLKELDIPDTDGICKIMNNNSIVDQLLKFLSGDYFEDTDAFIYDFIGKSNIGSSFDLGGFAQCKIKLPELKDSYLAKICNMEDNATFSPAATLTALTVDGAGLPSFSGEEDVNGSKKVDKRNYPGGLKGKEIFRESTTSGGTPDGGFLLGKAKDDPYGSTAVALNSFDKATIVLKTLAVMNSGTDDINETLLPATKADSMDMEDEVVGLQVRMSADLNQFTDTLTRALQAEFADIDMQEGQTAGEPHLMSLARYGMKEKNVTAEFFKSKESGLADIYKGIEDEAKARMASELLLMTADPNYIADPSEARAALVKPSQRNKFRYAALMQQEKNKMLKLKYATIIKRKQQMVDLAKKQAYIRASIFRASAAKHELEHILKKADESVSLSGTTTVGGDIGQPNNDPHNCGDKTWNGFMCV